MAQTYDLTNGKVTPLVLKFFFPMFFTNMLQQVYTIADTAIVGKGIGDNALAAVGNMSSLTFLIIGFSLGLANGFSVSIAKNYGAKDFAALRKSIASSIKLSVFIGILLTVISTVFLKPVLILLQTDAAILSDSLLYGYIIFGGLAATMSYNLCACILRALGDSKTPFIAIIFSTVINIALNYVSIYILGMGVDGAAIATILAQLMSTAICLVKLRRIDIIQLSREDFATDLRLYGELFSNGIPMALMNSITAVGCMVVQYFVNGLGVAYTSAYSVCSKYLNLFMQPACTAGYTMSSFTSQNCGAKKYSRVGDGLKVCLGIAFVSYVLLGSVMFLFPEWLARLMLTGDGPVSLVAEFLPVCGIFLFGVDFLFIFRSGVQGMGYPLIPMVSGIAEMVMRISIIILFVSSSGFVATAYAEAGAWLSALLLNGTAFFVYYRKNLKAENGIEINKSTEMKGELRHA